MADLLTMGSGKAVGSFTFDYGLAIKLASPNTMSATLQIVLGAIIAILTTIFVEYLRKPKLSLRIAKEYDSKYANSPATEARFLSVDLVNDKPPWIARWMLRSAALQSHGHITFHHLDGQDVFGRKMPIRWSSSPEPKPIAIPVGNQLILIRDPQFNLSPRLDVYPGETGNFNIAAKFDQDPECYGWSNESYFSNPTWRNPDWKLAPERYLVKVTVFSAGETCTGIFRLIANGRRTDFRLIDPLPEDLTKIS